MCDTPLGNKPHYTLAIIIQHPQCKICPCGCPINSSTLHNVRDIIIARRWGGGNRRRGLCKWSTLAREVSNLVCCRANMCDNAAKCPHNSAAIASSCPLPIIICALGLLRECESMSDVCIGCPPVSGPEGGREASQLNGRGSMHRRSVWVGACCNISREFIDMMTYLVHLEWVPDCEFAFCTFILTRWAIDAPCELKCSGGNAPGEISYFDYLRTWSGIGKSVL